MALISHDQAIQQLRLMNYESAPDLTTKMDQATALVITYIKRPDHGWTLSTDPTVDLEFGIVQAAILDVLAQMHMHRGDEGDPVGADVSGGLSARVRHMLSMLRDPALA